MPAVPKIFFRFISLPVGRRGGAFIIGQAVLSGQRETWQGSNVANAPAQRGIQPGMELEQVKPNKPSFGAVVALSAAALLLIFVVAWIILTWRAHSREKTPFSKHPVALVVQGSGSRLAA